MSHLPSSTYHEPWAINHIHPYPGTYHQGNYWSTVGNQLVSINKRATLLHASARSVSCIFGVHRLRNAKKQCDLLAQPVWSWLRNLQCEGLTDGWQWSMDVSGQQTWFTGLVVDGLFPLLDDLLNSVQSSGKGKQLAKLDRWLLSQSQRLRWTTEQADR